MAEETALPRAERRRRTEARILDAARSLFADMGYERATIRAVAKSAGVDPALVMQYFGSKQELFQRAVEVTPAPGGGSGGGAGARAGSWRCSGGRRGGRGGGRGGAAGDVAHEAGRAVAEPAGDAAFDAHPPRGRGLGAPGAGGEQIDRVAETLPGEDARLRAALMTLVLLGVTVGHQLLELDELRDVPEDEIARLLRPSLRALTGQDPR
ncbi:TetR/AcrR family transcriptional regulator [Nonomuraea salmonea]|uniref:TetR/AcrR family transcriptional regulator n=1 Tax=Nonomuraea salmonea TaxID=46181 RepID=UPI0031E9CCA4